MISCLLNFRSLLHIQEKERTKLFFPTRYLKRKKLIAIA